MMSDGIFLNIDDGSLDKLRDQLSEKELDKVSTRGINKGLAKANTLFKRRIAEEYNIKQSELKEFIFIKRASYSNVVGTVSGAVRPISLSRFKPEFVLGATVHSIRNLKNKETGKNALTRRMKKATKRYADQSGVTFEVKKGQKENIPFAFMTSSDGNAGVAKQIFARGKYSGNKFKKGKSRYPIAALKTVSPFGMLTKEEVINDVSQEAVETARKEFERQVQLIFRK